MDEDPEYNASFCSECGERAVSQCECGTPKRGEHKLGRGFKFPLYCHGCGKPYEWTKRRKDALTTFIGELAEIDQDEKRILQESVSDVIAETPRTEIAVSRFSRTLKKLGTESARVFKDLLVKVCTTIVIKKLGL
jgi:hypothetical protein